MLYTIFECSFNGFSVFNLNIINIFVTLPGILVIITKTYILSILFLIVLLYFKGYLSLSTPSPHRFSSIPLKSVGWDKKTIQELLLERERDINERNSKLDEFKKSQEELNYITRASNLEDILSDKTKNDDMNKIIAFYETYFDEESGNTRKEGINQLKEYLNGELWTRSNDIKKLQEKILEINKVIHSKKEAEQAAKKAAENVTEENKKYFIPIIPINIIP